MFTAVFIALFQATAGPAATPAAPETPAAVEAPAQPEAAQAQDPRHQRRCRIMTYSGSRLGTRVCSTPAEDEMMQREAQDTLHKLQRPQPTSGQ